MDKMDALEVSTVTEEIDMEDLVTEDYSSPEDPLVNLTKAPTRNIPESQVLGTVYPNSLTQVQPLI